MISSLLVAAIQTKEKVSITSRQSNHISTEVMETPISESDKFTITSLPDEFSRYCHIYTNNNPQQTYI